MGYKFDERGFMVIPDPRQLRLGHAIERSINRRVLVVKHAYCPNGHDLVWEFVDFNGFPGIHMRVKNASGAEGDIVLSPIFGDHTRVAIAIQLVDGEKLEIMCPVCGIGIPVLSRCPNCEAGELRVVSLNKEFDIANGVAFCDVVNCPSSHILDSGEFIAQSYLEEL